ncbi:MAG: hypothetical protein ACJ8AW_18730 [Rhodopila sp.]
MRRNPSNAERQRAWRLRHRGEPRGNAAMMAQLAALQARVAQLEVELSTMPSAGPRAPTRRLWEVFLALKQERDELAVQLAQIEAYQPGITAKAQAWVEQVDRAPQHRR